MDKFGTITKAKQDVQMLNEYIELWEGYIPVSVEEQIIKEYALLSSMENVKKKTKFKRLYN